jgi:hypothetical protein
MGGEPVKLLPLVLLLMLAACVSTDPYAQIAAGNAALQQTQAARLDEQRQAREKSRQATEAAMMTAEADRAAIDRMNAEADATLTAIDSQARALEVAQMSAEQTRQAWEFGIAVQATEQAAQATSTALAIDTGYQASRAAEQEERREVMAWLLPSIARIIFAALIVLAIVLVIWAWRIGAVDAKRRETEQRKRDYFSRYYPARNGTYYLPPGEDMPVLVNQLERIWIKPTAEDQPEVEYPDAQEDTAEPELIDDLLPTDNRARAIRTIEQSISANGDTNYLPGYRLIPGSNSEPWKLVRNYLLQVSLIYRGTDEKNRICYWVKDGGNLSGVREILISTSPTPVGSPN